MDAIVEDILGSSEIKSLLRLTIKRLIIEECAGLLEDVLSSDANSQELKLLFSHKILQISDRYFGQNNGRLNEPQNVPAPDVPNNTPLQRSGTSSEANFAKAGPLPANERSEAYRFVVSMNNVEQIPSTNDYVNVAMPQRPNQGEMYVPYADPQLFVLSNVKQ